MKKQSKMSNNSKIVYLILLLSFISFVELKAQDKVMTIQECLDFAIENNINVKNAKLDQKEAKSEIKAITGIGLPQITGAAGVNYNYKLQTSLLPDFLSPAIYGVLFSEGVVPVKDLGDPSIFPASFQTKYTANAGLTATQMVFNGSYFVGLEAARVYSELRSQQTETTINEAKANIKKAAYAVLVNEERASLLDANISTLEKIIQESQVLFENGLIEKTDVDRLRVSKNNLIVEKQNALNAVELSKLGLKFQMGMAQNENIVLKETLKETIIEPLALKNVEVDYNRLPEYKALDIQRQLTELDVRSIKVQRYPSLVAVGTYGANAGAEKFGETFNFSDNWFENGFVGLSLNWNILDGFARKNRIDQAQFRNEKVNNAIGNMEAALTLQATQAARNLTTAYANLEVQKENQALAKEVLRISQIKYKEGVGSNLEVITAETENKTANTNYYAALYQLLVAKVEYQKATGTL